MNGAKQKPVNRRFGGNKNCPQSPKKSSREELLKAAFAEAAKKKEKDEMEKRANRFINDHLKQFPGKGLIYLLPWMVRQVTDRRIPRAYLEALLERIRKNQWKKLSTEDQCLVIQTEAALKQQNN